MFNTRDAKMVEKINELLPTEYSQVVKEEIWNFELPSNNDVTKK